MKQMLSLMGATAVALFTVTAFADPVCLPGDTLMGPNCVHAEHRPGRLPMTTVYQVRGENVSTVWNGPGAVTASTAKYLIITEWVSDDAGNMSQAKIVHKWTGLAYEP